MAVATAKRINNFLDLPVSIITDNASIAPLDYSFDNTITIEPDRSNWRKGNQWINKGRYNVFDYTPYTDTLVLDVDYLINSSTLNNVWDIDTDFCCHSDTTWLLEDIDQEYFHKKVHKTHWATVLRFKKTKRVQQIFNMVEMIQNNWEHYINIYKFRSAMYRNDYAITVALKTVNGHLQIPSDYFHWNLVHVGLGVKVHRDSNTEYTLIGQDKKSGKPGYIKVKDIDFHMLNKHNFMELVNE